MNSRPLSAELQAMTGVENQSEYIAFLKEILHRKTAPETETLRNLAQRLGYRSPRSLGMILSGERLPSSQMTEALSRVLRLENTQKRRLEVLVQLERHRRRNLPTAALEKELQEIPTSSQQKKVLDSLYFSLISKWHHLVIKQLVSSRKSLFQIPWIQKKLRDKVSPAEIQEAFQNLHSLGFLHWNKEKKSYEMSTESVMTPADIPSEAVKAHHRQMMDRAKEALAELPVELREISSLTFRARSQDIGEIKKMIREFRRQLENRFEDPDSSDVFQLNVQFFPHTDLENKNG